MPPYVLVVSGVGFADGSHSALRARDLCQAVTAVVARDVTRSVTGASAQPQVT